ncbi:hypothetical protein NPX13_g8139 [Xylaria arbuscula]|uniref:3-beta hydroxysteroid dehydrogenase/isomerase domain-containing protein n=1 Tax=Xylaria arbuscula TaxID=114810 RepID=A0A9W8N986_9PEZI|nr:hypothetical protein NPX13_g8139 [Xylaria arbuscula]
MDIPLIHAIEIDTGRNRFAGASYHTCDISVASDACTVFAEAKPKTVFHVACPDSIHPAQKRVYTLTNAVAEADIPAANRESGDASMLTVSLRPSSTFGERDTVIIGKIVSNARVGKAKFQIGPGNGMYDFMYVSNLVDAHILAAQALVRAYSEPSPNPEMRVDREVFNVTNEERVNFWSFQQSIAASVGLPVRKEDIIISPVWIAMATAGVSEWLHWVFTFGRKPSVTREAIHLTTINRTLSNAKARRVLGYKPRVSVDSGLAKAGKWYIEEA